jgi:hypothetical protein
MASVPSGQTASYALWLEDVGFAGTVAVTCSGLPAGAICNTPRGMVLTAGSGTVSVWVTVATGSQPGIDITRRSRNESQNTSSHNGQILWGWIVLFFPLQWRRWWWTRRGNRERRIQKKRLVVTLILTGICLAMGGGMAGCGSSKDSAGKMVAPGTYSFTITATGTGNTTGNGATMTATLVVEK